MLCVGIQKLRIACEFYQVIEIDRGKREPGALTQAMAQNGQERRLIARLDANDPVSNMEFQ